MLARLFPHFFVKKAYRFLTLPQVRLIRPHERDLLAKATKSDLKHRGLRIQLYQWGNGSKKVLLAHGWEGHAGNFSEIIPLLMENGCTVYAFDGPAHGASEKGSTSSFAFIDLVKVLVEKFEPSLVISHSFGSVASLLALGQNPHLNVEGYIGITVPNKFRERLEDIAHTLGLPYVVVELLIEKIEKEQRVKVDEISVEKYAPLSSIARALILHDQRDRVLPIEKSMEVAKKWKNARFIPIENSGHYKILRSPDTLNVIRDFICA